MKENSQLRPVWVQKADMAVSDLTSGGALVREQQRNFFLVAIKKGKALQMVRNVSLGTNQREIPKMTTFGSRIWRAATEMQELPLGQRVTPGFDKVTLSTNEIIAQINFPRYFLQAQVEKQRFRSTLIAYLGMHSARDFEEFILNGDTSSTTDNFLALADGIRVSTTSNTYGAGGASLSSDILETTMQTMPDEYSEQEGLGFYTSRGARSAYRKEIQARATAAGDKQILQGGRLDYEGIPIEVLYGIPTNLGVGANQTVLLHLNLKNWIFAIEEDVEMESDYHPAARMYSIIMTARIGQDFEHEPAAVQTTALANS